MISAITSNSNFQNVVISTGNILNIPCNMHNKLGRKSNEELQDGLKLTLLCKEAVANHVVELNESGGQVLRASQELNQKLTENERAEISIGAKIFLSKNSSAFAEEAVVAMLQILKVKHVDNVVLAYHPNPAAAPTTPVTPNPTSGGGGGGGMIRWNSRNDKTVADLKELWTSLEQFALQKQITQLGISDLDMETLSELHEASRVPPTIAQINLTSCCVVPPALQEFCTKHDIQLLTHSDPEILLPADEEFIIPGYTVDWTLRYQVHLRCRGVLTAKGYIVGASKQETAETA